MKGIIFDIQRFSVHDGPGIRTTVFMKGCPLRCKWCHNPEGLSNDIQIQYFEDQCIDCGRCQKNHDISAVSSCPAEAIKICGRAVDSKEIIEEILKDKMFYGDNGGITFSGGECLTQYEFVADVLASSKKLGLHTAIDTSGCAPWVAFEKTIPYCDIYLYDIKCMDSKLHKEYTGVDNKLILDNLKKLATCGKEIWIRIPLIPDFNNNVAEITAIADLVSTISSISQVTLMPYHTLGASKYKTLGLTYTFDTSKKITDKELETYKKIFAKRKIHLI
jgi:pyruvate formate lyase activating enzyme